MAHTVVILEPCIVLRAGISVANKECDGRAKGDPVEHAA